jgi:single-strand DNA-binding protein
VNTAHYNKKAAYAALKTKTPPSAGGRRRRKKMNQLNSVLLEGYMAADPKIEERGTGKLCYAQFSIGSNRYWRKGDDWEKEVSFFVVQAWSKLAEKIASQGKKGKKIRIVGRLLQNKWTDDKGEFHSFISIIAEHIDFPEYAGIGAAEEKVESAG